MIIWATRRGSLFCIDSDLQVAEHRLPYAAAGCGEQIALGALHATSNSGLKPKKRIEAALKAAEQFSAGVRGPFTIESCK